MHDTVVEIAQILYKHYTISLDIYNEVRKATIDPKEVDWELFHEQRLRNAMRNKDTALRILDEFKAAHKQVLDGAFK